MSEEKKNPRFCKHCHRLEWNSEQECSVCHGERQENETTYEEISHYSREAHNHDIDGFNRKENALCFVVIGSISLIIGLLFIFLSLKKKANKIDGVNFGSFAFVICIVGIAAGLTLLTIGIVRLIKALKIRRQAREDIAYLEALRDK